MRRARRLQRVAFAALIAAVVIGGYFLWSALRELHEHQEALVALVAHNRQEDIDRAKRRAVADARRRALRNTQIRELHAIDVSSCASRHTVVAVVLGILEAARDEPTIAIPDLTPGQAAALEHQRQQGLRSLGRGIGLLHAADCVRVAPLPQSPPPAPAPRDAHERTP